jgi:hypothetical protein
LLELVRELGRDLGRELGRDLGRELALPTIGCSTRCAESTSDAAATL